MVLLLATGRPGPSLCPEDRSSAEPYVRMRGLYVQANSCPVLSNACEIFISIGHSYVRMFEVHVHA